MLLLKLELRLLLLLELELRLMPEGPELELVLRLMPEGPELELVLRLMPEGLTLFEGLGLPGLEALCPLLLLLDVPWRGESRRLVPRLS